jgi:hypothetical protein
MACCCGATVPKCNCPNDPPSSIDVTVFDSTGSYAVLNGTYTLPLFDTRVVFGGASTQWFYRITLSSGAYVEYRVFCTPSSATARNLSYGAVLFDGSGSPFAIIGNSNTVAQTTSGDCAFNAPSALTGANAIGSFKMSAP